jgi:hypothetical protein
MPYRDECQRYRAGNGYVSEKKWKRYRAGNGNVTAVVLDSVRFCSPVLPLAGLPGRSNSLAG